MEFDVVTAYWCDGNQLVRSYTSALFGASKVALCIYRIPELPIPYIYVPGFTVCYVLKYLFI